MLINVYNRSTATVCYSLPELNVRRVFNIDEKKAIDSAELEALVQTDGGLILLQEVLLVDDKEWVRQHFDAPIEYWWTKEQIKDCVLNDDVDLFTETLEYAPEGVIDYIKYLAWALPLSDLNKIAALKEKTGFDSQQAQIIASAGSVNREESPVKKRRLRREE